MGARSASLPPSRLAKRKSAPRRHGRNRKSEAELLETHLAARARARTRYAADAINRPPKQKTGPKPSWSTEQERRDHLADNYRKWSAANREHLNAQRRRQRAENPARFKAAAERRWAKIETRLSSAMRCAINRTFRHKRNGARPDAKGKRPWELLVGYTRDDLVAHIEPLFEPGMSWDNFGEWHIDHRRPIASFTFASTDDPEFRACWALKNLRPLWAHLNRSKGAKWDGPPTRLSDAPCPP